MFCKRSHARLKGTFAAEMSQSVEFFISSIRYEHFSLLPFGSRLSGSYDSALVQHIYNTYTISLKCGMACHAVSAGTMTASDQPNLLFSVPCCLLLDSLVKEITSNVMID